MDRSGWTRGRFALQVVTQGCFQRSEGWNCALARCRARRVQKLLGGQEIGIDTGNVTRHRGFFIIDRSVPVGFVPGSRLNTDDCVLVRRLIE